MGTEVDNPPAPGQPASVNVPGAWSPATYLKFEDERTRPARDLLAQIGVEAPRLVVDVGCGPGNSTALLKARWPAAEVVGLDTSGAMLAAARERLPEVRFEHADAANWLPGPGTGVVFANAVYQWIPEHLQLFPWVLESLESGGVLAVQMPDNMSEATHVLMRETAAKMAFADKLEGAARQPLPPVSAYYDALSGSARRLDIWHTVYNHVLADAEAIVEWVRGTGLSPFLERLAPGERDVFLAAYTEAIADDYRPAADGKVLLAFPRLFIVAER